MILIPHWTDCITLSHWPFILAVGLAGQILHEGNGSAQKSEPAPAPEPVEAVPVKIETLRMDAAPPKAEPMMKRSCAMFSPPSMAAAFQPPAIPQVADGDADDICFVLPCRIDFAQTGKNGGTGWCGNGISCGGSSSGMPVQTLVFGEGEGRQPAPHYPRRAARLGQEGSVTVVFDVDQKGRISGAEISSPSPWPLLDRSALRTVLNRWRFGEGDERRYEVTIRFELQKQILK